jgi:hypothetical protein
LARSGGAQAAAERLKIMNAISRPQTIRLDNSVDLHPDAKTELARHYIDLRVHALVMLLSAVLAGYCGIRVLDIGDSTVFGESMRIVTPPDLPSICALAVFFSIASLCLLEAHRGWRKATIASGRNTAQPMANRPFSRLFRSGI